MNYKTFKVKCLETLSDGKRDYFIEGNEYEVTDQDGEYVTIDETKLQHTLATGGMRSLRWFNEKFQVLEKEEITSS